MDYIDAVDDEGEPTSIALIARRVESYTEVIDELRDELQEHHEAVDELEIRASNLMKSLQEKDGLRGEITQAAQVSAMKAAMATTSGMSAQLRNAARQDQRALDQFEADYAQDETRYKSALRALDGKQQRLMEVRDQIARRLNIVDALLQRAEIEWPSYFFDENERIKAKKKSTAAPVARRRSGRGRRRIIRRRRAS